MIKKIYNFIFKTSIAEKKITLKDIFFTDENENITRIIRLVKKTEEKINEKALILDVGAFNGETAKKFSSAFPSLKIIAFEANNLVYKTALKNCELNKNITIHNCAISDNKEKVSFYITSNDVSSSLNQINELEVNTEDYSSELNIKNKVTVDANKLDEFSDNNEVLILKIDTQGHELKVLAGAKETLKNTKFVLIEMSNHNMYINGCKYHEVDEVMRQNNFTLLDLIVTYRKKGMFLSEYDAIYANNSKRYL